MKPAKSQFYHDIISFGYDIISLGYETQVYFEINMNRSVLTISQFLSTFLSDLCLR